MALLQSEDGQPSFPASTPAYHDSLFGMPSRARRNQGGWKPMNQRADGEKNERSDVSSGDRMRRWNGFYGFLRIQVGKPDKIDHTIVHGIC
ncbi:MAG: hypothetical protein EA424_16815 [Planctomycetaceae bacterium]|nr:MAG: hypothetical protein EA424_16815 [Planctomycetaceae bacterium]